jgi:hypothetical protein
MIWPADRFRACSQFCVGNKVYKQRARRRPAAADPHRAAAATPITVMAIASLWRGARIA